MVKRFWNMVDRFPTTREEMREYTKIVITQVHGGVGSSSGSKRRRRERLLDLVLEDALTEWIKRKEKLN